LPTAEVKREEFVDYVEIRGEDQSSAVSRGHGAFQCRPDILIEKLLKAARW